MAGTVSDDNLASVAVWNTAPEPDKDFEAQLRQQLFIARAVGLEEGGNDLYALALDKAGNESRYPENETEYHTVNLDSSVDLDYVYDANGCLIRIEEGSTVLKEYVYDYENRLIKVVEDPDGTPVTLAEYQYDGLGRRVWSNVNGVETRFIYDGESVIEEYAYDDGWALAAVYVHGAGTDNVLAVTRDGQTFYYHYDGLGSVTELTDADGLLAQAYEYDAWGIPTIYDPEHASGNPYLFTGRRWDAALALYYYRARHYAPDLGRFLQPDPIGYEQTTNLYAYVGSTPTAFIDPSGLFDIPDWLDVFGIEDDINKGIETVEQVEDVVRNLPDYLPEGVYERVAAGYKVVEKLAPAFVGQQLGLPNFKLTTCDPRAVSSWINAVSEAAQPTAGEVAQTKEAFRALWGFGAETAGDIRRQNNLPLLSEAWREAAGMVENYATDLDNAVTMTEKHGPLDGTYYLMGTWVTGTQHMADAVAQWDTANERFMSIPESFELGKRGGLQMGAFAFFGSQAGRAAAARLPANSVLARRIPLTSLWSRRPGTPATGNTATLPEGSFSIRDWSGYPPGPRPRGPFRLVEGTEYQAARKAANVANRAIHQANPTLTGLHIHEVHPVKFGGSTVDLANKRPLTPRVHSQYTKWWNNLMRSIRGR